MASIGECFNRDGNNFDALRLGGALLVLFSHSYVLTGRGGAEPIGLWSGGVADGGRLAVAMFFALSGFLVARSAQAHSAAAYAEARALRIWPGLAAVIVAQTLLLGPVCSTLGWRGYFGAPATWEALVRGLVFDPRLGLPGVFGHNPVPDAVNGSLWTLRVEVVCYAMVLALARFGLLRRASMLGVTVAGFAAVVIAEDGPGWSRHVPALLSDVRLTSMLECGVDFLMGASLWVYRGTVPRHAALAAAGLLALLLAAHTMLEVVVFHVVWPYLVLCAGLGRPILGRALRRLGDVSYGTYLYAFPVQQALVAAAAGGAAVAIGPLALAALATPSVLCLAILSRRWVELPALRLKRPARVAVPMAAGRAG